MPSETPLKNDGSFFKWWDLDDCIMQQDETAFLMQNAVATAKYHFNATYSFNDSVNISGAGTIASSSEVDSGDVIKKTFSANANDGYMF